MMFQKKRTLFIVSVIAIVTAILNIFHVLVAQARTPSGYFYTGTGHYFLDYFAYLQLVGAGIRGKWFPINYVNPADNFVYLLYLPYIILGHIASFFHLSAVLSYWLAIFFLTIIVIFLIYQIISYVLKDYDLYLKISALLIAIYSSPFYLFKKISQGWEIVPYDFWYGPNAFVTRFGLVPHQLLVALLVLLLFITGSSLMKRAYLSSPKNLIKNIFLINVLLITIAVISPISTVAPLISIGAVLFTYSHKRSLWLFYLFVFSLLILFLPVLLGLKMYYEQSLVLSQLRAIDISWTRFDSLSFLLLNIGPVLIFLPFGLKKFIRIKVPIVFLLLTSTLLSYLFYYSNLSEFFGTHNLRFFSLTNYIAFGILTILGIKTLVNRLHLKTKVFIFLLVLILMIVFSTLNIDMIKLRLQNKDDRIPTVATSYLPNELKETFAILNKETDSGCILTDPYDYMGMVLPVYIERKSCIGKSIYTFNFEQKQVQADLLLKGELNDIRAKEFLNNNNVKYILLTSIDAYSGAELVKYKFLKKLFFNNHSVVFKYEL